VGNRGTESLHVRVPDSVQAATIAPGHVVIQTLAWPRRTGSGGRR
jgi:hypothetical protein